ncbi:hypothetical protein WS62_04030 [Burkholderia sp. ABCPW 14]|uniref:hypothetical protein n=1 Tax=Burkholderia sp. ABCPW 14 TaxID=1637860 RepID=UPI000770BDF2|nr:hypothetical protein [Burkholderia sp. ABCPW 14]KVD74855.1 hypothetical protein WS62_04030 [Burkholderia sp. ABCPW 14]
MTRARSLDYATDHALDCIDARESSTANHAELPADIRGGAKQADPAVWPVLDTVWRLYSEHRARLDPHLEHVGMIHYGSAFPKRAARQVIDDVARSGRVSPLTFIHANAGAALSICCTRFGFRGPTLNLTMAAADAGRFADIAAARWLERGDARYLFVVAAEFDANEGVTAKTTLYARAACVAD